LPPHFRVKQIAAGNEFTILLSQDGFAYSFGFNGNGQLGQGNATSIHIPTIIPIPTISDCKITNIIASNGCEHCFAISQDGMVWAMGYNNYNQLGITSQSSVLSPLAIPELKSFVITNAACSYYHSIFVGTRKSNSEKCVLSCGRNEHGQVYFHS